MPDNKFSLTHLQVCVIYSLTRLMQDAAYSYMPFFLTDNLLFPTVSYKSTGPTRNTNFADVPWPWSSNRFLRVKRVFFCVATTYSWLWCWVLWRWNAFWYIIDLINWVRGQYRENIGPPRLGSKHLGPYCQELTLADVWNIFIVWLTLFKYYRSSKQTFFCKLINLISLDCRI